MQHTSLPRAFKLNRPARLAVLPLLGLLSTAHAAAGMATQQSIGTAELPGTSTPAQQINNGTSAVTVPGLPPTTAPTSAAALPATADASSAITAGGVPLGLIFEPRAINYDGIFITPKLVMGGGRNDNLTLTPANRLASNFVAVSPQVVFAAPIRDDRYELALTDTSTRYFSDRQADTNDYEVAFSSVNKLGVRAETDWRASYQNSHDPIGSTDRSVQSPTPDQWEAVNVGGLFRYGAKGATGNIEGEVDAVGKRYLNNRNFTRTADFNALTMAGRFFYRLGPKTQQLTELRVTHNNYITNTTQLDNDDYKLFLGGQWDATNASSGTVKIGYERKHYENSRPSYSGLSWEGSVRWLPRTYSQLEFKASRTAADPTGEASNYQVITSESATWTHSWRTNLVSTLGLSGGKIGYNGLDRKDRFAGASAGLRYDFRRSVRVGVNFEHSLRNSTVDSFDYRRNLTSLTLELAL